MSRINKLCENYKARIAIPWRSSSAPPQRVIFCVYTPADELRLRATLKEFELATTESGHDWHLFDLTNTFPNWLASQKYAESYYKKPELLPPLLNKYLEFLSNQFSEFLKNNQAGQDTVIAIQGVGTLFGLVKVKTVVDNFAPLVKGRLVVFFPGTFENNNYRLLDGYDGWNYLAEAITAESSV